MVLGCSVFSADLPRGTWRSGSLSSGRCSLLPSDPKGLRLAVSQYLPYCIPPALPLTWAPAWNCPFPLDLMACFGCCIPRRDRHLFRVTPRLSFHCHKLLDLLRPFYISHVTSLASWDLLWRRVGGGERAPLLSTIFSFLCCFFPSLWASQAVGYRAPCLFIQV